MAEDSDVKVVRSLQATFTQKVTSPLPLASEIKGYEEILPGSADRILTMVEKESEHRRELEKRALELEGRDALFSMGIAATVAVIDISGIVGLILGGYTEGAGILAGSSVVSLIAVLFNFRKKVDNNLPPNED